MIAPSVAKYVGVTGVVARARLQEAAALRAALFGLRQRFGAAVVGSSLGGIRRATRGKCPAIDDDLQERLDLDLNTDLKASARR
jgi:hypothetical protein